MVRKELIDRLLCIVKEKKRNPHHNTDEKCQYLVLTSNNCLFFAKRPYLPNKHYILIYKIQYGKKLQNVIVKIYLFYNLYLVPELVRTQ